MGRQLTLFLALLIFLLSSPLQAQQDKTGVSPQVISLPSGPGSIEGLGESFEPQLNTGTSTYAVKIALPPGRNGFQPGLSLQYNSGSSNSAFGLGWSLPVPYIQRQTDKGQPKYREGDRFIYSNGEELIALVDGTYALKNATSFLRFEKDGESWLARDKSGQVYRFGLYPRESPFRSSRIGRENLNFDNTFKWYLDERTDTNGNKIEYSYSRFNYSGVALHLGDLLQPQ